MVARASRVASRALKLTPCYKCCTVPVSSAIPVLPTISSNPGIEEEEAGVQAASAGQSLLHTQLLMLKHPERPFVPPSRSPSAFPPDGALPLVAKFFTGRVARLFPTNGWVVRLSKVCLVFHPGVPQARGALHAASHGLEQQHLYTPLGAQSSAHLLVRPTPGGAKARLGSGL